MKTAFVPIGLAAILLTGCASPTASPGASATPVETKTTSATPSASASQVAKSTASAKPATSREEKIKALYLEAVREGQPGLVSAEDDGMITIGQGFCKMYDGGATGKDVNAYILKAAGWAYTVPQLMDMHGAAVGAFCPEHIDKIG